MHAPEFDHLMAHAGAGMDQAFPNVKHSLVPRQTLKSIPDIAESNRKYLANVILPDKTRIPTEEELEVFKQFAIEYKRCNKRASKREIRKAVQNQFNIIIYK